MLEVVNIEILLLQCIYVFIYLCEFQTGDIPRTHQIYENLSSNLLSVFFYVQMMAEDTVIQI